MVRILEWVRSLSTSILLRLRTDPCQPDYWVESIDFIAEKSRVVIMWKHCRLWWHRSLSLWQPGCRMWRQNCYFDSALVSEIRYRFCYNTVYSRKLAAQLSIEHCADTGCERFARVSHRSAYSVYFFFRHRDRDKNSCISRRVLIKQLRASGRVGVLRDRFVIARTLVIYLLIH